MSKKEKFSAQVVQTSAQDKPTECLVVHIPWRPIADGEHICRRTDVLLSPKASRNAKMALKGLYEEHRTMQNGRHVDTMAHVVNWVFENLHLVSEFDPSKQLDS
jgi:hypothetical protein